jgi:AraC-like DNA-binding protein
MSAPRLPPTGFSAPFARVVIDYVQAQGVDAAAVQAALALSDARLQDASERVSAQALTLALAAAARLCGDPLVGLRVAEFVRPTHLGSLGYALMSCDQARGGLLMFEQMQALLCNEVHGQHRIMGDILEVRHEALGPVPRDTGFWLLYAASRLAFARWVSGREMAPLRIDLPCPAPLDTAPVLRFFGGPVRFDTPDCRELMPAHWLDWANPNADATVHGLMSSMATSLWQALAQSADALLAMLSQRIVLSLHEGTVPTLEALAAQLAWQGAHGLRGQAPSARQLQRRLAEQGLNFKDLVEQVRKEQALSHLRLTELPLAQVAQRVGYAEPSSFHRAVRRWTGLTPLAVRQQGPAGHKSQP